ncbi:DUF4249 domain-containing protein [Hymenobacter terrestris]|uniref:DUF4249 domain-containing protein n=1 Tax=Hymenobacter terrestris TaxID=2748310 RepID=A0ABX2Q280_9BACT|nr:DUF4249 domain-containing protein [Hymenobacter terrestris]NVO83849.1 DUF4249 domain-containing protein [Hymenobacter terrestris]
MMRITGISRMLDSARAGLLATGLALAGLAGGLASCGLQKDIDVVLPVLPAQLVVEAYLEDGQVPRLTVTESVAYLSAPTPTIPTEITVTLTLPDGSRENLRFAPGFDRGTGKAYTHIGTRPLSPQPGQRFQLEVTDNKGRRVTGSATMPARIPIDTVEWQFNDREPEFREALILTRFRDPATPLNFYRIMIHKDSITDDPESEFALEDRLNNGEEFTLGTSFRFRPNDTVVVTLFHLDQAYNNFLESVEDARNANGNPFSQPAGIRSTVEGGIGVFTVLSYDRRTVIVR